MNSLGVKHTPEQLIAQALRHPSTCPENRCESNQRLEFLGDSVLQFFVSQWLYQQFPHEDEGSLTRLRSSMVCEKSLAIAARQISLDQVVQVAPRTVINDRVLADAMEALLAALFLGGDQDVVEQLIASLRNFSKAELDPKSSLNELCQKNGWNLEIHCLQIGGEPHAPVFEAVLEFGNQTYRATGRGKKEAQEKVAQLFLSDYL